MSGYKLGNTQSAWDEELQVSTHIGYKSEWINTGMKDGQRVIWKQKLIEASKADPKRNYYCCHKRCNAMIVNQGPVNEWFFSTKVSQGVIQNKCNIQDALKSFTNSSSESVKHLSAKKLIFDYLNENKSREMYDIDRLTMEEKISKGDIKIQPDITIYHHDKSVTYVEIVNFSSPHKNKNAWKFYEKNPNLVIVDVKGNQEGWYFNHHLLRQILISKFDYSFKNKGRNHIKYWEEVNNAIEIYDNAAEKFSFNRFIKLLQTNKPKTDKYIRKVRSKFEERNELYNEMIFNDDELNSLREKLNALLHDYHTETNEITFERGFSPKESPRIKGGLPIYSGYLKKYFDKNIESYISSFKRKYQDKFTSFRGLEFYDFVNDDRELFFNTLVIRDHTDFNANCKSKIKEIENQIDSNWIIENKELLFEAELVFDVCKSLQNELKGRKNRQEPSISPDYLETLGIYGPSGKPKWISDLEILNEILASKTKEEFAKIFVQDKRGIRKEDDDGRVYYDIDGISIYISLS